jgi:hypothetical protein
MKLRLQKIRNTLQSERRTNCYWENGGNKIAVKVVDIFGNDIMKIIEVSV